MTRLAGPIGDMVPIEILGRTAISGGWLVSTVRLPFKHQGGWFETCVFRDLPDDPRRPDICEVVERYDARAEALEGHRLWGDRVASVVTGRRKLLE